MLVGGTERLLSLLSLCSVPSPLSIESELPVRLTVLRLLETLLAVCYR